MRTIALATQKGGQLKTTTTLALGVALAEQGYRVLLVDCDAQGSLTASCGVAEETIETSLYDVLQAVLKGKDHPTIADITIRTAEGPYLAPCDITLSKADIEFTTVQLAVYALRDALELVAHDYDFALLDCPPNLATMTANALAVADQVIIPVATDYLALKGLSSLLETINSVQRRINRKLRVAGVVLTLADMRLSHTREVIELVKRRTAAEDLRLFDTIIRSSARAKEAPVVGKSVLSYASNSQVAQAYRQLAREILQ
jgi:chromosome partitioning protein